MRPTKRFEQLLSWRCMDSETLTEFEEFECDICGDGYALVMGWVRFSCSVAQREQKEWGEYWHNSYDVCLDCVEAGVAGFPERLRKHAEALEERARELRQLADAKWRPWTQDDEGVCRADDDPLVSPP